MTSMESDYIKRLKKGEQKALDYIVERFLPVVKGAVYKILSYGEKAGIAEEYVNDVFLSVWKNVNKFQGETDLEFKKWIYKIAKFKAIDYYRKVCRFREITVSEQDRSQQRSAEDKFILLENKEELIAVINPALAADIPVVGDIFRFLDNGKTGNYVLYKQYSDEMNLTSTDNGVAITIEDALFDGRNIYYTYRIETDKDLGESPSINDSNFEVQGYEEGMSGGSQVRKVKDNVYVGQDSWTLHEEKDKVNIKIQIKSIYSNLEQEQEAAKLKGNWQFKFALNAAKGEKTVINQSVEAQDIKITVESITKTPMSSILNYSQFVPEKYIFAANRGYLGIEMKVKDDLVNEYRADGASSFSLGSKPGKWFSTQKRGCLY